MPYWNRSEFEAGQMLGREQERERIATYFHDRLVGDLMVLALLAETVRLDLEKETHAAEPTLKKIRDGISDILQSLCEKILDPGAESMG